MSRSIVHVKQEIRILGLDTCNPRYAIGVVIRGGHFLDGVIAYPRGQLSGTGELAIMIFQTKYFQELRVIMLHDSGVRIDPELMQSMTRLPVIVVSTTKKRGDSSYQGFPHNQQRVWIKAKIGAPTLGRILSLTLIKGRLPEPLRIAHMLAKQSGLGKSLHDKE